MSGSVRALRRALVSDHAVLILCIAYLVAVLPFAPHLASIETLGNILSGCLPLLVVAIGQTFVLIAAGIDLSVTSTMALASVAGAAIMTRDGGLFAGSAWGVLPAALAMLAIGLGLGAANGAAVAFLRMPPFIVTLAAMTFTSGLAIWVAPSTGISGLPPSFLAIGQGTIALIPCAAILAAVVAIAAHVALERTLFGHRLRAAGYSARVAIVSGVPVRRTIVLAYATSGACAAIASIILSARLETGSPTIADKMLLDVIAAAVIGGTSLFGGRGRIPWTAAGVLFIRVVDESLVGLSNFAVLIVKGSIILFAALIDAIRARGRTQGDATAGRPAAPPGSARGADPGGGGEVALAFDGIGKRFFGVPVLRDIRFELRGGRILGLVGENGAGKTTLMNILAGVLAPDEGRMALAGETYAPRSPHDAARRGIAFIHQELNLFPNLTVAENLFIDGFPRRSILGIPFIARRTVRRRAREALDAVGLEVSPDTPVEDLSPGERQLLEIAKAMSLDARIIILDEPTTSLTARESKRLFDLLRRMRARGVAMIYISHVLADVFRLCDGLVVLRDGEVVGEGPCEGFTEDRLIALMVGRSIATLYPPRASTPGEPLLDVRGITRPGIVRDIRFRLRRGEILGIYGMMGSGRTELARILFGLDAAGGDVRIDGSGLGHASPAARIRKGVAYLTEDRREEGLLMEASVTENLAIVSLPLIARTAIGFIGPSRLRAHVAGTAETLRIRGADIDRQPVKVLSGGNQQKVVLGKWILAAPRIFILDEPTRGIDVGAKHEVYGIIERMAEEGAGIIFISSEIEELAGMCDRILVLCRGEIRGEVDRGAFNREAILRMALPDGRGA